MEISFDEIKSLKSVIISFDFKPQTFRRGKLISLNNCGQRSSLPWPSAGSMRSRHGAGWELFVNGRVGSVKNPSFHCS